MIAWTFAVLTWTLLGVTAQMALSEFAWRRNWGLAAFLGALSLLTFALCAGALWLGLKAAQCS